VGVLRTFGSNRLISSSPGVGQADAVLDAVGNGSLKVITAKSMYENAPAVGVFENPTG
jgi:hypothetical protein